MSEAEFRAWCAYYECYPFDDFHRFHRPAAMVAVSAWGGDIQAKLDYLAPDPKLDSFSQADITTMRAFGVNPGI